MRNNEWLKTRLDEIWQLYFNDIPRLNSVSIVFGRSAKRRLASIRQMRKNDKKSDTLIKVTGYFKDEKIPEFVVDTTIAHELCHYAHGFASPLPQFHRYPHRGDVVDKEMTKRGLEVLIKRQNDWLKTNWADIVKGKASLVKSKRKPGRNSFLRTFLRINSI